MIVTFQLPDELERDLRLDPHALDAEAKEAFLVSLYRQGRLTHLALSDALGLDRLQTEELLHKHNVTEDLGTPSDYFQDLGQLNQILGKPTQ